MKECTVEDDKKIRVSDKFKLELRKFMDEVAARLDNAQTFKFEEKENLSPVEKQLERRCRL